METGLKFFALLLAFSGVRTDNKAALVSFNTGLLPKLGDYFVRKEIIPELVADLDAEVVCLQEVFCCSDMVNITKAAAKDNRYPYHYSSVHSGISSLPDEFFEKKKLCEDTVESGKFFSCANLKCVDKPSWADRMDCLNKECHIMTSVNQQCISCLVLANSNLTVAMDICTAVRAGRINVPGVLLLSKLPLSDVSVNYYHPNGRHFFPMAYISAQVEGLGVITCAHHIPYFGEDYFEVLSYDSWAAQNLDEASKIVAYLSSFPSAILLGSLNTSPKIPSKKVSEMMKDSYDYFIKNGFKSPYVDDPGKCTYCKSNPYTFGNKNYIPDHVMLKNHDSFYAERIFDEYEDDQGEDEQSKDDENEKPPSDHYGIRVVAAKGMPK